MIAYVTLGADDIAQAERFYTALLGPLGYSRDVYHGDLSYIPPGPGPDLYIKRPFNGAGASTGNGTMVALEAGTQAQVRALHAAGIAAGGTDDGPPGFRDDYSADFFVAYLRDPQGNKLALFSTEARDPQRKG